MVISETKRQDEKQRKQKKIKIPTNFFQNN